VFDFINASFAIQPMLPASTLDETEIAQNAGPRISGNIDLSGVFAGTPGIDLTVEAQIYGTAVSATAIEGGSTDVRLRVHRSRMRRIVEGTALVLQDATESRFDQLVDILAYGRLEECFFGSGMTIVGTSPSSNTTPGFYDCQLNGTFTGPAYSFWFDLVTDYWFNFNGCAFAGGATALFIETGLRQIPIVNTDLVAWSPGQPVTMLGSLATTAGPNFQVVGLVVPGGAVVPGATGRLIAAGPLTLLTTEWDAVTGGVGGLAPGARYFVTPGPAGFLTTLTPTAGLGDSQKPVGLALSTTTMAVQCAGTRPLEVDSNNVPFNTALEINFSTGFTLSAGGSVVNVNLAPGAGWLGDGSDGDVTISVNTTLTRNMFYNSLEIEPGVILDPGGYAIFCLGTIILDGDIERNGNPGAPGIAGVSGGAGGAALTSGFLFGSYAGGAGGFGGGVPGVAGGSTLNSPRGYAGTGGAGGFAGFSAAGPGGTVTNELPQGGDVRTIREMVKLRDAFGAYIDGGAGGGGGGGAGGGGGGGGGGSGGSVIMVATRQFTGAGVIRSLGGMGGPGVGGVGPGGGGGGMGGFIGLVIAEGTAPSTDVSGGAGGAVVVPGAAGSAGLVITLTIGP
jgi:hypothetical protein